jgi:23S rRNA (uracil1939-C5)-methyltransferase
MGRQRYKYPKFENVKVIDLTIDGKAVAKVLYDNPDKKDITIFITKAMPGDIVNIQINKKKKNYFEGYPTEFVKLSSQRVEPICKHYGICGGCTRQDLDYKTQLEYKQRQIEETLKRIGKIELPQAKKITASEDSVYYRNKLEYTFSNKRWLTEADIENRYNIEQSNALGFHIPGRFDKVLDITECKLQSELSNEIKNFIRQFAFDNKLSFYDLVEHHGLLRNLIIRTSTIGEIMVLLSFAENKIQEIENLLKAIQQKFQQITSIMYVINPKKNDTILDLDIINFSGKDHIIEQMGELKFKVGPKSFYQTNSKQAHTLYKIAKNLADLKGTETVYDLYTGTGTIANFVADKAKKVIGIEYVPEAIEDAKVNSEINGIKNTEFYAGDMKDILNEEFIEKNGKPDVIILDPPRAGIHGDVINTLINSKTEKIVYISCNPATQARDLQLLGDYYEVLEFQPVDMFPHTHHTENVVLLKKKL